MQRLLCTVLLLGGAATALAAELGVSVSIGQPGFYGRLDIGDDSPPQLLYRQPRAVWPVPVERPPIYLRVPPGHAKNWRRHCRQYDACGERVYFVRESWYQREYVPRYEARHRHERGDGRDERRDHDGDGRDPGRNRY